MKAVLFLCVLAGLLIGLVAGPGPAVLWALVLLMLGTLAHVFGRAFLR